MTGKVNVEVKYGVGGAAEAEGKAPGFQGGPADESKLPGIEGPVDVVGCKPC